MKAIKNVYEEFGVLEYWIVDPFMKNIRIYELKDGRFELFDDRTLMKGKDYENLTDEDKEAYTPRVKSSLFPDLEVSLEDVFMEYDSII